MYDLHVQVAQSHIDADSKLRLNAAIDFLQDCEQFQILSDKLTVEEFRRNHYGMFLVSRQVDVLDMPSFGDRLTVRTTVFEVNRLLGYRNTVIYDESGRQRIISYAVGAFVNLQTGHAAQMSEETIAAMHLDARLDMDYLPRKIAAPTADSIAQLCVDVKPSFIDSYHHVNNSRYTAIAADMLPQDFKTRRLRVEYKQPAHLGDTICARLHPTDKGYTAILTDEHDHILALVELQR